MKKMAQKQLRAFPHLNTSAMAIIHSFRLIILGAANYSLHALFVLASLFLAPTVAADTAFEPAFRTSLLKIFAEANTELRSLADAIP